MKTNELKKELIKTLERLAINDANWWNKRKKTIITALTKIETKGISEMNRAEKVALSEYFEIMFYQGKIMAYIFVMQELSKDKRFVMSQKETPTLVSYCQNLKGIDCSHLKGQSWNKGDKNLKKTYAHTK